MHKLYIFFIIILIICVFELFIFSLLKLFVGLLIGLTSAILIF